MKTSNKMEDNLKKKDDLNKMEDELKKYGRRP
jgi:hypothetical protein